MTLMSSPFLALSSSIMLMSSIMAMSSNNWFLMWAALELNLLSFIPIILYTKNYQETEAAIKYFMSQALGSSLLLMSSMALWFSNSMPNNHMNMLMLMALMIKTGMVPCHLWFPSVMTSISWMSCLILSTWQKLAPVAIMSFMLNNSMAKLIGIMAMANALIGGIMGMNQSHLRTIMAYSSITHMGWMLGLMSICKPMLTMMYFMMYTIIISPIFLIMHMKQLNNTNIMMKMTSHSPIIQLLIPLLLLSLSGLPPLTGFIPKWLSIYMISMSMNYMILPVLITGAMMNTYFYLNILFNTSTSLNLNKSFTSSSMMMPYYKMSILASMSLMFIPLLMM